MSNLVGGEVDGCETGLVGLSRAHTWTGITYPNHKGWGLDLCAGISFGQITWHNIPVIVYGTSKSRLTQSILICLHIFFCKILYFLNNKGFRIRIRVNLEDIKRTGRTTTEGPEHPHRAVGGAEG